MFTPEDFEIPLEKQLRMRLVLDEIDGCDDVEVLRGHLKACTETVVRYQHILSRILEAQLKSELSKWLPEASKIVKEADSNDDAKR